MALLLPSRIEQHLGQFGDRPAIVTGEGLVTHDELWQQVDALAFALDKLLPDDARVGLLLPNLPVVPSLFYALLCTGRCCLLLNPLCSQREIREYLNDSGTKITATTAKLASLLPPEHRKLLVDGLPGEISSSDSRGERTVEVNRRGRYAAAGSAAGKEAAVVYTTASAGWGRGARLSHSNLIANLESTLEAMQLGPADRVVAALPLVHLFGLTVTLNAPLAAGACVIPVERFNPVRILEQFELLRPTVFCGVPAMYAALLAVAAKRGVPEHGLRVAISGGAPLPQRLATEWEERFGIPLRQGYGLTEAGPVCLFNRVDHPNQPGTLGRPFPRVRVTIRGPEGGTLPPGEVGEICVAGDNVFLGYVGENGRQPADFFGDALRTGDLGTADAAGTVTFRGVLKPMFTRNGFNVYPREIERALAEDPRIAEVRVCALPDPERENDIVLTVRAAAGAALDEAAVRDLCSQLLAAYKQPSRVILLEEAAHAAGH